jgi:hypothetical protein
LTSDTAQATALAVPPKTPTSEVDSQTAAVATPLSRRASPSPRGAMSVGLGALLADNAMAVEPAGAGHCLMSDATVAHGAGRTTASREQK